MGVPVTGNYSWEVFCFLHSPMADWRSSLDSGVNSAVVDYRSHAVEVRMGVMVRVKVMVPRLGLR